MRRSPGSEPLESAMFDHDSAYFRHLPSRLGCTVPMGPSRLSLMLFGCLLAVGCGQSSRDAKTEQEAAPSRADDVVREAERAALETIQSFRGKDLANLPKAQAETLASNFQGRPQAQLLRSLRLSCV